MKNQMFKKMILTVTIMTLFGTMTIFAVSSAARIAVIAPTNLTARPIENMDSFPVGLAGSTIHCVLPTYDVVEWGKVQFTVTQSGYLYLALNFAYQGNDSGGWTAERWQKTDFVAAGWIFISGIINGPGRENRDFEICWKQVIAGQTYSLRCNKYEPPYPIVVSEGGPNGSVTNNNIGSPIHYVSLSGSHIAPFTSWVTAATNIQSAINTASTNNTVLVSNGTYRISSTIGIPLGITVKSVNGAGVTIIDGQYPRLTNDCILVTSSTTIIDGFTVRNGNRGVVFQNGEGGAPIRNSIIVYNKGDGVYSHAAGNIQSCTIAYNGGVGFSVYDSGWAPDQAVNVIIYGNGSCYNFDSANIGIDHWYTNDPHFYSTNDFRLRPDSPCINAGKIDSYLAAWMTNAIDAAGNPRICNGVVDIGAYEYSGSPIAINPPVIPQPPVITNNPVTPTNAVPVVDPGNGNNGNGNNDDGVDVSNPGQGLGGPNGEVDPSGSIDDETKPRVVIDAAQMTTNGFQVQFALTEGLTYDVECSSSIGPDAKWEKLARDIRGQGQPLQIVDANSANKKFYRLKIRSN